MRVSRFQYKNDMICSVCGEILTLMQSEARKTKLFKVIEHECPNCKKQRKFIIIENIETARLILERKQELKEELTQTEQIVTELLKKTKTKVKK